MPEMPAIVNVEPTIYELSSPGRTGVTFPEPDVPDFKLPENLLRKELPLPELAEADVVRHYVNLSKYNYSVDGGFYPLGSCTMKYNPKINEDTARLPGFALHPSTPARGDGAGQPVADVPVTGMAEGNFRFCRRDPPASRRRTWRTDRRADHARLSQRHAATKNAARCSSPIRPMAPTRLPPR